MKSKEGYARRAILNEDIQTLLDGERGVKDDEPEAERENVIGISGLEEVANGTLFNGLVEIWISSSAETRLGRGSNPPSPTPPYETEGVGRKKQKGNLQDPVALPDGLLFRRPLGLKVRGWLHERRVTRGEGPESKIFRLHMWGQLSYFTVEGSDYGSYNEQTQLFLLRLLGSYEYIDTFILSNQCVICQNGEGLGCKHADYTGNKATFQSSRIDGRDENIQLDCPGDTAPVSDL